MEQFTIKTNSHAALIPITHQIRSIVKKSQVSNGVCIIFCPHTTAGLTINENADPDVTHDLLYMLDKLIPWQDKGYRHIEGNSAAHLKASLMGSSVTVIIDRGELQLGTWQEIYLAEFDGPRTRKIFVKIMV